jgi:2-isopropylmalate synthase
MTAVQLYDTTLRDGAQGEGVNFSLQDKLAIAVRLDELGFNYIEGGYPLSNPKDEEFFQRAADMDWKHAKITAFGMTRRKGIEACDDVGMQALVNSKSPVITIVGKTWDLHVTEVLNVSLEENLAMIRDSIAYAKSEGREVIYDAEHCFDGWRANPDYAMQTWQAAADAGADMICMCDTNGGTLPAQIAEAVTALGSKLNTAIGIHTHNDSELAIANSLAGVEAGAIQVQGTINGIGERCGNADLISVAATDRTIPLCLRNREHEFPKRPAVRGIQCIRTQGWNARPCGQQDRSQLRAHSSNLCWKCQTSVGERTFRSFKHHGQNHEIPNAGRQGPAGEDSHCRPGPRKRRLPV